MTTIWRRAGRLALAWWRGPAAIWSKTGWSRPACAGRWTAPRPCSICARCASMAIGIGIGSFIDSSNITDCIGPHLRQRHQKCRHFRWQPDAIPRILVTLKQYETEGIGHEMPLAAKTCLYGLHPFSPPIAVVATL